VIKTLSSAWILKCCVLQELEEDHANDYWRAMVQRLRTAKVPPKVLILHPRMRKVVLSWEVVLSRRSCCHRSFCYREILCSFGQVEGFFWSQLRFLCSIFRDEIMLFHIVQRNGFGDEFQVSYRRTRYYRRTVQYRRQLWRRIYAMQWTYTFLSLL